MQHNVCRGHRIGGATQTGQSDGKRQQFKINIHVLVKLAALEAKPRIMFVSSPIAGARIQSCSFGRQFPEIRGADPAVMKGDFVGRAHQLSLSAL